MHDAENKFEIFCQDAQNDVKRGEKWIRKKNFINLSNTVVYVNFKLSNKKCLPKYRVTISMKNYQI